MKLIRPTTLTDAMLTSSTAPENDYAVWASGTAYAVGSRVILTSTHRTPLPRPPHFGDRCILR